VIEKENILDLKLNELPKRGMLKSKSKEPDSTISREGNDFTLFQIIDGS
jgi:hypothetical protein